MSDTAAAEGAGGDGSAVFEFGGLRFDVSFRGRGATLRVLAPSDAGWDEMLRFDDFIENPHFHAPPSVQMPFDTALGEPLAWYVAQVRDHLAEWITRAGFASVLPKVDVAEITAHVDELERAMVECVPDGYVRVAGVGIRRVPANA